MITAEQAPPTGLPVASVVLPGSVDDAHRLARLYDSSGFSMIPIRPGTMQPSTKWTQYQTERASIDQVFRWIAAGNGLAVVLGQVSNGWVCRDFDDIRAYELWAADYRQLAESLPSSRTQRGFHVFVRVAEQTKTKAFDDGELRGEKSYVVVPPTGYSDAPGAYHWIIEPKRGEPTRVLADTGLDRQWSDHAQQPKATVVTENTESQSQQNGLSVLSVTVRGPVPVAQWERIEDAIELTMPPDIHNRNGGPFNALLRLARKVIAILDGRPDSELAEQIGLAWFERAWKEGRITTADAGVTCAEFAKAIESVKSPDYGDPIATAFADSQSLPVPSFVKRFAPYNERAPTIQLAKLVVAIDRHFNGGVWYLSCHKAGRLVGMQHSQANTLLKKWAKDKVLEIVKPGVPGRPGNKATRYQFVYGRSEASDTP